MRTKEVQLLSYFFNFPTVFEIGKVCRFAQIIFQKIATPSLREVDKFDGKAQCGQDSFGSTGLKHAW